MQTIVGMLTILLLTVAACNQTHVNDGQSDWSAMDFKPLKATDANGGLRAIAVADSVMEKYGYDLGQYTRSILAESTTFRVDFRLRGSGIRGGGVTVYIDGTDFGVMKVARYQ